MTSALVEAGLRFDVELWCDGGMKTGEDAIKMILAGANRVGSATMAMVSIGWTICRKCHERTCHVGTTTHIKTLEEAEERNLRSFVPRNYDHAIDGLARVFEAFGGELQQLAAQLGATRLQDLVGRADLLEQFMHRDRVDLSAMFGSIQAESSSSGSSRSANGRVSPDYDLTQPVVESIRASAAKGNHAGRCLADATASDRVLGAHLAGALVRQPEALGEAADIPMHFGPTSVAGNGAAAWIVEGVNVLIEGGAQDGAAKGASGGRVMVMKGLNADGSRVDGSVGESFAYGARSGALIVQGNADSRACIRLSGADVAFGDEITRPLNDSGGNIGVNATLKGFACSI